MALHNNMSPRMGGEACDLYVHFKPASPLQDISPVVDWLKKEFQAIPVFPTSLYIGAENLYEENNAYSFAADLTEFLGTKYVGLEIVICPTNAVHRLSCELDGSEPEN